MPTVYGMSSSGNCYKVRLLLELLGRPYDWVELDTRTGVTREQPFLNRNPNGRVPVLEYQPGQYLAESDAILYYLAQGTSFWPAEPLAQAQVLQWMFFEQYSHEPYIAVARFISLFLPPSHPRRQELPRLRERGHQALAVMQQHLAGREWFVGDGPGIADVALYAYTHAAADGGVELEAYPAVRAWLARFPRLPRYVTMPGA